MLIKVLSLFPKNSGVFEEIKTIFFLTSPRKSFDSPEIKDAFFKKWVGHYMTQRLDFFYVAYDEVQKKVLGYLTIEPDSKAVIDRFHNHIHYKAFVDYYAEYPAHLHINCHPETQGKGIGSKLIERASQDLKNLKISGLHLITAPTARNVSFYRKNGFEFEIIKTIDDIDYLLMGKKL